jgi:hypothetical protein
MLNSLLNQKINDVCVISKKIFLYLKIGLPIWLTRINQRNYEEVFTRILIPNTI